jgi:BMFP domain-containing protein YqiC
MTQTTGRFFDEIGKLITDAAGAAEGVRKEVESVMRSQAERVLRDLDVVQREEFEAVKAMAQKAREENEQLKQRIAELEARLNNPLGQSG